MPSIEGLAEASGLTRAELLQRGLAAGLAVGAAGVLADGASGATPKAPHAADGLAKATGIHKYDKPARGAHFAAWEEPELFAGEVRAAFRSLR